MCSSKPSGARSRASVQQAVQLRSRRGRPSGLNDFGHPHRYPGRHVRSGAHGSRRHGPGRAPHARPRSRAGHALGHAAAPLLAASGVALPPFCHGRARGHRPPGADGQRPRDWPHRPLLYLRYAGATARDGPGGGADLLHHRGRRVRGDRDLEPLSPGTRDGPLRRGVAARPSGGGAAGEAARPGSAHGATVGAGVNDG
jgi:hypothetical protein